MNDALVYPRPVVLIASGDEWFARSVESLLAARDVSVVISPTARKALEYARTSRPDAIFMEARLPDMPGIELCRMLRADSAVTPDTPVVIATIAPATRRDRIEALRAGAWEYCDLLPDSDELLLRLNTYMRAKIAADRIRDASLQDMTTGLYNLRGLTRRLDEVGVEAIRHRRPLSCLAISVDVSVQLPAARVNTRLLAEQVAKVVVRACRASDAVARLPTNEFVVLAPDTGPGGAQRLAERVVLATESGTPSAQDARPLRMNVKVGFCAVEEFTDATIRPSDVLSRATAALQRSRDPHLDRQIVGFVIPGP